MKIRDHIGFTADVDEHKRLRRLLTEEMLKDWCLPPLPTRPRAPWTHGALVGYWRNERLIGGAFIGPLSREADELLERGGMAYYSAYQWLTKRCVVVHYIHTNSDYRRQGDAPALLDFIEGCAVDHGDDYIIAVPTNPTARHLFTQAGYVLQPAGVHLGFHRQSGELTGIFPAGPHDTYARRELGHRHDFTLRAYR
ncbi:GNAT family N-acetyltransferase [Schaalia hyovaginalis]|uniref:GNAT family N-acetyltransferase n=1 Tax=Schaalia hyovaginalis TaxID=29316 RepID=UPI002A75B83C|nr:GNAT family N-acetyltransferase [Schaalia hyovaginalis]MDY2669375.1 GNAT family N-acetyltransferase [Schaalia hyovaginalis]MDY6213659.1 GNAT family N-acetyltransferase [Schaalia hyovaginalis]